MKWNQKHVKLLQDAYSIRHLGATAPDECPESDLLWEAAHGKLALEERKTIVRHTMRCQECAQAWRVARRLGARPAVSARARLSYFWTTACHQIWQDLRLPLDLAWRGVRWVRSVLHNWTTPLLAATGTGSVISARLLAAAVTVIAAGAVLWIAVDLADPPDRFLYPTKQVVGVALSPTRQAVDRPADLGVEPTGIESLVQGVVLPRDRCVLRWSGPEGTRYDLRITTEDLDPLDSARGLAEPEYRIPIEKLEGLEPGAAVLWQVIPLISEQNRWDLKTFRSRIE